MCESRVNPSGEPAVGRRRVWADMTRLDKFLAYAESNRLVVCAIAVVLIGLIAWVDWLSPDSSTGFLYLVPVLLSAAALNGAQILVMAVLCGYLREVFDPLQGVPMTVGPVLWHAFNPLRWVQGSYGRLSVSAAGFAMTGFFFAELNRRRRLDRKSTRLNSSH